MKNNMACGISCIKGPLKCQWKIKLNTFQSLVSTTFNWVGVCVWGWGCGGVCVCVCFFFFFFFSSKILFTRLQISHFDRLFLQLIHDIKIEFPNLILKKIVTSYKDGWYFFSINGKRISIARHW